MGLQGGHDRFVVEQGRIPVPLPSHVQGPGKIGRRRAPVKANLVVGVPHAVFFHDLQHEVSEGIGGVVALLVHAAHDGGLHDQVSPVVLRYPLG